MIRTLLIVILMLIFSGCDEPVPSNNNGDAGIDVDDIDVIHDNVKPDADADADAEDIQDGDVDDWEWVTVDDPDEVTVACNGGELQIGNNVTIKYPFLYHHIYHDNIVGDIAYLGMKLFRYNFETGINEELETIPYGTGRVYGGMEPDEPATNYFIGCKRTIMFNTPDHITYDVIEQECKKFIAQDVATGELTIIPVEVDLRSEDCILTGTSEVSLHQYDALRNRALLGCNLANGNGSDYYIFDFNDNTIEYLYRKSLDPDPMIVSDAHINNAYYNSTFPFFVRDLTSNTTGDSRLMVWNWVTGELVWSLNNPNHKNTSLAVAPDGFAYYLILTPDSNGLDYIQLRRVDLETGEDVEMNTHSRNNLYPHITLANYPQYIIFMGTNVKEISYSGAEPTIIGPSFIYIWDMQNDIRRKISPNSVSKGSGGLLFGTEYPRYVFYHRNIGCTYIKDLVTAGIMDASGQLIYDPNDQ